MDKKTKRQINKKVLAFEKECLLDMLLESDDVNVKTALEQALIAVKLIHSVEIDQDVKEYKQKLINEEHKKNKLDIDKLVQEIKDNTDYKKDYWCDFPSEWAEWSINKWTTTNTEIDKNSEIDYDYIKNLTDWSTKPNK